MRQLTFHGFTKKYVRSLSMSDTTAIYPLVREAIAQNPRLREPLFLYAVSNGNLNTLLAASQGTPLFDQYFSLSERFTYEQLLTALQSESPSLLYEYHKVWRSYQSISLRQERDNRVKGLMRDKVVALQAEKKVSSYRLAADLGVNVANMNAWLKHGTPQKVSLDVARKALAYMEGVPSVQVSNSIV